MHDQVTSLCVYAFELINWPKTTS